MSIPSASPTAPIPVLTTRPDGKGLVVFLENGGSFGPWALPPRVRGWLDFGTEEAAKLFLHWHGARAAYDRIWILEDHRALPEELLSTLLGASQRHVVDVLILAHGHPEGIVGWQGARVGTAFFAELEAWRDRNPASLRLRAVYTIACHSVHQAFVWLKLGAQAVNGVGGENWLPEPTLSLFLRRWCRGQSFGAAAVTAHRQAYAWGCHLAGRNPLFQQRMTMSQQFIAGTQDITIHTAITDPASLRPGAMPNFMARG